jgi:hypothetical protein
MEENHNEFESKQKDEQMEQNKEQILNSKQKQLFK